MTSKYVVQHNYPLPTGTCKGQGKKNPLKCLHEKMPNSKSATANRNLRDTHATGLYDIYS